MLNLLDTCILLLSRVVAQLIQQKNGRAVRLRQTIPHFVQAWAP